MKNGKSKKRIKIAHVVLSLDVGGLETFVLNFVNAIDQKQFDPIVICLQQGGSLAEEVRLLGVTVVELNKPERFSFSCIVNLAKVLKQYKVDALIAHHLGPLIYGLPASMLSGVKRIIQIEHSYKYLEKNKKLFFIGKVLFKYVFKVVGVCEDVTDFLIKEMNIPRDKCLRIDNGIDLFKFKKKENLKWLSEKRASLGLSQNDFVLGAIGRLDVVKNHRGLILAFAEFLKSCQEESIKLLVVGDGPERKSLEKLSLSLGLEKNCVFLGERRDIDEVLNIFDIYLLPSFSEGLSVSLLEAMASGCPIIASAVGGNLSLIRHRQNGLLVSPQHSSEICLAMNEFFLSSEKRVEFSRRARIDVEHAYSLESMIQKYQNLLKGIYDEENV